MAWTWRFEKADGTEVPPAVEPEEFTTQGDAESWVGEVWKDLLEGGADQAVLFEGETKIYGPMSLHAETAEPEPGADPAGEDPAADGANGASAASAAAASGPSGASVADPAAGTAPDA